MTNGILPQFWTPTDIRSAQNNLANEGATLNSAVSSCTALDANTRSNWQTFYTQLTGFCGIQFGWLTTQNPDGSWSWGGGTSTTANLVEQYARTLYAWQQLLSAKCSLGSPVVNPDASPGTTALVSMTKYAVVGAAFVATAYAISKVVSVIPRGEARLPAEG